MFLLLYLGETKVQIIGGRLVKMMLGKAELRDSYSIIPEKLAKFGAKKEIDYAKLEPNVRHKHMEEIREYLYYDCKVLFDAVNLYRDIAGKKLTIASNALQFSKKLGIDPGKTNSRFDKVMRQFFYGGRTECFQPGTHNNVRIIDIHSAYPFAMSHDHPTGAEREHITPAEFYALPREEKQRCMIILNCHSDGAFPVRSKTGIDFPTIEGKFYVTGWEYVAARELNIMSNENIIDVIKFNSTINFTPYVKHWYELKSATNKNEEPALYTIYKIMMNSLYGKLAQNPERYFDYKIVAGGTLICDFEYSDDTGETCNKCDAPAKEHGWELFTEFEGHEIHRRSALWKYKFRYGKDWEGQPIYNNVATGASITGFTRSHLMRAMHSVGSKHIIYCDTDSIICTDKGNLGALSYTDKLGDWEDEGTGLIGHFAGKKLYGIKMTKLDKAGNNIVKIASKGSKLEYDEIERIVNGETVTWRNAAPTFSVAGDANFVVRNIRRTSAPNSKT